MQIYAYILLAFYIFTIGTAVGKEQDEGVAILLFLMILPLILRVLGVF